MILRDYILRDKYLMLKKGIVVELEDYIGIKNGFFQNHEVGTVFFSLSPEPFLSIGNKKYDVDSLKKITYEIDGESRRVKFYGLRLSIIDEFCYKTFWIEESDILDLAFEFPEDDTRDILKYIANHINALNVIY